MAIQTEKVNEIIGQIKALEGAFSVGILSIEELDQLSAPLKTELKQVLLSKPAPKPEEKPAPEPEPSKKPEPAPAPEPSTATDTTETTEGEHAGTQGSATDSTGKNQAQ